MERTILPNATLFPNFLTDEVMPLVSGDEWKVIHFGVVACLRLDKGDDCVSIAQFVQGTGLPEDRVRECLAFLCDTAQIFLRQDRPRKPQVYRLNQEISAAQVEILEQRSKGDGEQRSRGAEERGSTSAPAHRRTPAPEAPPRLRSPAQFPEHPSVEIRLDGEAQGVAKRLHQSLPTAERAAFDHLLRLYAKGKRDVEDSAAWGLYRLWQTYGFACVNNALQEDRGAGDLSEINQTCLMAEIAKLYEQEIGQLTPGLQEELARLAGDFPTLTAWQDAFRIAVKINKRRLSTVETILKNQHQKEMEETHRPATRAKRHPRPRPAQAEPSADAGTPNEA